MKNATDVAAKALGAYLKSKIPELTVLDSFPDPKHKFSFPTVSIITAGNNLGKTHVQPEIFKEIEVIDNPDLIDVVYTIGQFDYQLQLDVWTDYKAKRSVMVELIEDALNDQFINGDQPCGLSLALTDYYDLIARFDQVGYTYPDSEESSQKTEWRAKMELNVTHSKLLLKRESKMLDIQIHGQISDDINVEDDNEDIEEITEI